MGMDGVNNNNKVTHKQPKYLRTALKTAKRLKDVLAGIDNELFEVKTGLDKAKDILAQVDPNNTLKGQPADSSALAMQNAASKVVPSATENDPKVAEKDPNSH